MKKKTWPLNANQSVLTRQKGRPRESYMLTIVKARTSGG